MRTSHARSWIRPYFEMKRMRGGRGSWGGSLTASGAGSFAAGSLAIGSFAAGSFWGSFWVSLPGSRAGSGAEGEDASFFGGPFLRVMSLSSALIGG